MHEERLPFPEVSGRNLNRQDIQLPDGFVGKHKVVIVAFQQWQQQQVDSWIPDIKELSRQHNGLEFYELPVISDRNFLWKVFINEGMRAGIPNQDTRRRTITLYLDKEPFRTSLKMDDEEDIYVLLLNESDHVIWRARGWRSEESVRQLEEALAPVAAH